MATLTTTMTYSNQTVGDFKNWAQPFGNAFSTLGWVNTNEFGAIQGTATYGSATISSVQINNGVLQIGYTGATNSFSSGQCLQLTGLTTNTFLNNQYIRIQNVLGPVPLYPTGGFASGITSVTTSAGGVATYAISIGGAITNFYVGQTFTITGFANLANNGTFVCTANGTTTLVLANANAVAETHAASASFVLVAKNTTYPLASAATSVSGTAVYTGIVGTLSAVVNLYAGATFTVTGFTNLSNNGTFVCTASTVNSLTLYNPSAVAEMASASAATQPDATNSVFTAYFSHADVAPVSDTGTATIVYNWNTVTNVPDLVANGTVASFPIGHSCRWRGAYVNLTPVFTNIQTTSNLTTFTYSNNAPHGYDLTYSKGLLIIPNGITNAAFTWLNALLWPITAVTSTTVTVNTGSSARADIASTPVTAGVLGSVYQGGNMAAHNASGQYICDVVTYNGDLYIASTTNTFGGGTNGPTSALNLISLPGTGTAGTKQWSRFVFDIWKSNDSLTATNPICFKVLYGNDSGNRPTFYFYWGCATDGFGNITTNYNWGPSQIVSPSWGGYSTNVYGPNTGTTDTTMWESDFSGTPGRFCCIPWRGFTQGQGGPQFVLNIERSHDNSGNDTSAYWTVVFCGQPVTYGATNAWNSSLFAVTQSIFAPGTGGAGALYAIYAGQQQVNNNNSNLTPLPVVNLPNANALSQNNSIPVLPVFPLVGYIGNPMIGMIVMKSGDTADGALVTASFYGTSHPYLMCTRGGCLAAGPVNVLNNSGGSWNSAVGIRWE